MTVVGGVFYVMIVLSYVGRIVAHGHTLVPLIIPVYNMPVCIGCVHDPIICMADIL